MPEASQGKPWIEKRFSGFCLIFFFYHQDLRRNRIGRRNKKFGLKMSENFSKRCLKSKTRLVNIA